MRYQSLQMQRHMVVTVMQQWIIILQNIAYEMQQYTNVFILGLELHNNIAMTASTQRHDPCRKAVIRLTF